LALTNNRAVNLAYLAIINIADIIDVIKNGMRI